jgi:hypothetical protein
MSNISNTLKISPVKFTSTDFSVLKVALNLMLKSKINIELLSDSNLDADLFIIDMDNPEGRKFFTNIKDNRCGSLLISSEMQEEYHNQTFLRKPIRVQTLRDIIMDMCQAAGHKTNTSVQVKPVSEFVAEKNLFFMLLKAQQEKKSLQVYSPPHSALFVNGAENMVATSATSDAFWQITHTHSNNISIMQLSAADFNVLAKGQRIVPLKNLLWTTAIYLSRGQLATDAISLDDEIQLKVWPNFSRLDFEPDHLRLATVMVSRALSLKQIAHQTGLPLEFVINFFNAAWVMDLILIQPKTTRIAKQQAQGRQIQQPKQEIKSGLLQKIANRLKLK